jgi:hypothetical protein
MAREIELTQGKVALVDDADYECLNRLKWYAVCNHGHYYAYREMSKDKFMLMHRLILNAPAGLFVDHRDGDGLNNQRDNLRLATNSQNLFNRGKTKLNTSGYKGVSWNDRKKRWMVRVEANGQSHFVGYFDDPEEAASAYDVAARELHGEFAFLNFP